MKKLVIIVLALVSLQAIAQDKKEGPNRQERAQKMMNLPAEDIATNKTKKMTLLLDLNKSQQAEIMKINLENANKRKLMVAERKAKKESGEVQKPTAEERLKRKNAKLDHKIAMKAKMKKILNEEQYGKWEKVQMQKAKRGKDKMKSKKGKKKGDYKK